MKKSLLVLALLCLIAIPAAAEETEANACIAICKADCTVWVANWYLDCLHPDNNYTECAAYASETLSVCFGECAGEAACYPPPI